MAKSLSLLFLAPFLLTACSAGETSSNEASEGRHATAANSAAEEQAIRAQVDRWEQLAKAKDADAIAALYTDDGVLMPPNAPIQTGAAALKETWASMIETPGFDLTITPQNILLSTSGDIAVDRGTYQLIVAPDGKAQTDKGKYVVVWRKVGGEWKAATDIFNSDLPAGGS